MILRMTLDAPIAGYWDGGTKSTFDFQIDGSPQLDAHGPYIRVGSWQANHWFHVAMGETIKATLANARRRLAARAKRSGLGCRFEYIETETGYLERHAFSAVN